MTIHSFLNEVYSLFGDDTIDTLRERALQCGLEIPNTLQEYLGKANIKEMSSIPSVTACLPIVLKDLEYYCNLLQIGVVSSGELNDVVTQNILSGIQEKVGVIKWKIERELA